MQLSIGIVGLPNVGKSTLFNALTKKAVDAKNYPFCTIDPSVGVVRVPDERLGKISEVSESERTIPAAVEFVDIAGLVSGAHKGEGLGNKFLSHIREVDAIAHVVRIFEDSDITHVHGEVNPLRDIEVINTELALKDLETVRRRRTSLEKEVKSGATEAKKEDEALSKVEKKLDQGILASSLKLTEREYEIVAGLQLLSAKKVLYVLNKKAGANNLDETEGDNWINLIKFIDESGMEYVVVDAGAEEEMKEFSEEEKRGLREEGGGVDALIKAGYELLDLITFFTTGPKESRAWTIERGSRAPEAGAAIHSDFQEKFIRAEVVHWDELINAQSWASARDQGLIRTEGKDYVVKDGDVVLFKI